MDLSNSTSISGHTIVVAGAASGIGREVARRLARAGAAVVVADKQAEEAERVARELGAPSRSLFLDVLDDEQTIAALNGLAQECPRIEGMVNSIGITGQTGIPGTEVPLDNFDLVWRVNVRGALVLSQWMVPRMVSQGYGRLVHIASISGKDGNAGMLSYSSSKAGLIGLVKSLAKDFAKTGVTINAIAPAAIRTPLTDAMPEHQVRYMLDRIPMGRFGSLEECAELIAWMVSPACSFITGFTFDLSGGRAVY
jgi:2-dehydro-3-deoxy-L-rhamnonate dehydrogenase (NAD+)